MQQPPQDWPVWRTEELNRNKRWPVVGSRLVSETDEVRIWHIDLAPGQRLPFHCHVLNYFWTCTAPGRCRTTEAGGGAVDSVLKLGDSVHIRIGAGGQIVHDLENTGDTVLRFVTVEMKIGSANAPLPLPAMP